MNGLKQFSEKQNAPANECITGIFKMQDLPETLIL